MVEKQSASQLSPDLLQRLREIGEIQTYRPGTVIVEAGTPALGVYLLEMAN
jgi:hypothetical protein